MGRQRKVIQNISKKPVSIGDICTYGISISSGQKFDLLTVSDLTRVARSQDCINAINADQIIVLDDDGNPITKKKRAILYLQSASGGDTSGSSGGTGADGATGPTGPGAPAVILIDGGNPSSLYGGISSIDCGGI